MATGLHHQDGQADTFRFPGALVLSLNPDAVFPDINIQRGPNEKTIAELRHDMLDKLRQRDLAAP